MSPKLKKVLLFVFALLTISVNFVLINKIGERRSYENKANKSEELLVTRVIDGDTIELENGDKVRYLAVDAPEIKKENGGCYSDQAKLKNESLVLRKLVKLESDSNQKDKYDRILAYVWVDNVLVNMELVRDGFARADTFLSQGKYDKQIIEAEKLAKEQKRGLWGDCY